MYYVYQLIQDGKVVYVGETQNPKQRMYDHTKRKPKHSGHGLFYGLNLEIEIIECYATKKEAWHRQVKEQKKFGFATDYDKLRAGVTQESCSKGGKTAARRRKLLTSK